MSNLRFVTMRRVLGVIVAVGAGLLLMDIATDNEASGGEDHFSRIDAYVREQMDDSRIPGVAFAVVEDGQVVHARGFGEDGRGNPIAPDTPFWIGSTTKSITALVTMQLVESGQIDLKCARTGLPIHVPSGGRCRLFKHDGASSSRSDKRFLAHGRLEARPQR